jgi:hypothetical protein
MAWTAEDRRRYAPVIQEMVRQGMLVVCIRWRPRCAWLTPVARYDESVRLALPGAAPLASRCDRSVTPGKEFVDPGDLVGDRPKIAFHSL